MLNEQLTDRVRVALAETAKTETVKVEEKRMFRGVTFMVDGKMCISVGNDRLMCRIGPERYDAALERNGASAVIMRGREMRGFVNVQEDAIKNKRDFDYWITLALDFNTHAKASKKKAPKKQTAKKQTAKKQTAKKQTAKKQTVKKQK